MTKSNLKFKYYERGGEGGGGGGQQADIFSARLGLGEIEGRDRDTER